MSDTGFDQITGTVNSQQQQRPSAGIKSDLKLNQNNDQLFIKVMKETNNSFHRKTQFNDEKKANETNSKTFMSQFNLNKANQSSNNTFIGLKSSSA